MAQIVNPNPLDDRRLRPALHLVIEIALGDGEDAVLLRDAISFCYQSRFASRKIPDISSFFAVMELFPLKLRTVYPGDSASVSLIFRPIDPHISLFPACP